MTRKVAFAPVFLFLFYVLITTTASAQDLAPDDINGTIISGNVTYGSGDFADRGFFEIEYSAEGTTRMLRSHIYGATRLSRYKYKKVSPTRAIITEQFDQAGYAGEMETVYDFSSPTGGKARAKFISRVGSQQFNFTISRRTQIAGIVSRPQSSATPSRVANQPLKPQTENKPIQGNGSGVSLGQKPSVTSPSHEQNSALPQSSAPLSTAGISQDFSKLPDWAKLAALASFPYETRQIQGDSPRSSYTLFPQSAALTIQFTRRIFWPDQGGARKAALLGQIDQITDSSLVPIAQNFRRLFLDRYKFALANEKFGNTPGASMRDGYALMAQSLDYALSRAQDVHDAQAAVDQQSPDQRIAVTDAPASERTSEAMKSLIDSSFSVLPNAQRSALMTDLLQYADFQEVHKLAALWKESLMPEFRKLPRSVLSAPVITLTKANFRHVPGLSEQRLASLVFRSTAKETLHNVVVVLTVRNEFDEGAFQYYFVSHWEPGAEVNFLPHFGWDVLKADYSSHIRAFVREFLSDEGRLGPDRESLFEIPNPSPSSNPEKIRRQFLRIDNEREPVARALSLAVRNMDL